MLKIFGFICICLNCSAPFFEQFFLCQIARGLCLFKSNHRRYAKLCPVLFFLLAFVWQAVVSFRSKLNL